MGRLVVREGSHPCMGIDEGGLVLAAIEGDRLVEVIHRPGVVDAVLPDEV